jgi:hypothetical protein
MRSEKTQISKITNTKGEKTTNTMEIQEIIRDYIFFLFFLLFYYSYVHTRLGSFLPPAPTPSLTTHSVPSLSPKPQYPAETILPLSLILLKKEYKQ